MRQAEGHHAGSGILKSRFHLGQKHPAASPIRATKGSATACPGFRAIGQKCLMFNVKHFGKIDDCATAPAQGGAIRGRDLAQAEEGVKVYFLEVGQSDKKRIAV